MTETTPESRSDLFTRFKRLWHRRMRDVAVAERSLLRRAARDLMRFFGINRQRTDPPPRPDRVEKPRREDRPA